MNAKQLSRRIDGLSTKLWDEMDRVEKLKIQVEDFRASLDVLPLTPAADYSQQAASREKVGGDLEALSWKLAGIVADLQEAAYGCGEVCTLVEEFAPPEQRRQGV